MLSAFYKDIKRIEFHEVTKKAITNAIENPRDIKESLVKAQVLRRVSDRWVGFLIFKANTKTLWQKLAFRR